MTPHELATFSLPRLVEAQRHGALRAVDWLEAACAAEPAAVRSNAVEHLDWTAALARARELDDMAAAGRLAGPLHGVPVTVKGLFVVEGMPMSAGTRARLPALEAEGGAVARLRAAGAVVLGKTRMHEIALGATGENFWTGDVTNPHDASRQSGGSSSGAGVAVACGLGRLALGSDTGGSIRIPAAFCGVVGFKPSFGSVPLDGALPLSPSFDHAGPLARSVADAALAWRVLAGRPAACALPARRPRLAVPAAWNAPRMDADVADRFAQGLERLRTAGAELVEVDAGAALDDAWAAYTPIVRAEAATVHRATLEAGGEGFSPAVLAPLQDGLGLPASRYLQALAQAAHARRALRQLAAGVDAVVLPTSPVLPPPRGTTDVSVQGGTLSVRQAVLGQTLPFSLAGLPAVSLPLPGDGLPVGLQLVGAFEADAALLALAAWCETRLAA